MVLQTLYDDVDNDREWTRKPTEAEISERGSVADILVANNPSGGWLEVTTTTCEIFN